MCRKLGKGGICGDGNLETAEVIVLEADGSIGGGQGYGTPIIRRLSELGITAAKVRLEDGRSAINGLPPIPLIISGGMTEVTSDVGWLNDAKEFVKQRMDANRNSDPGRRVPVLGICFGAQLIAECYHPGSVLYLDDPEIGVTGVPLEDPGHPLFDGYGERLRAYTFHYNQICSEELTALSTHSFKGHRFLQAFELPEAHFYGVQFHPDFIFPEFYLLLETYGGLMEELGLAARKIISSLGEIPSNARLLLNFVEMERNK